MKAIFWLRMLAWVKRGAIALESIERSQKALAEMALAPTRPSKKPKMAEVFTPSVASQNEEWQRRRDEEIYGE